MFRGRKQRRWKVYRQWTVDISCSVRTWGTYWGAVDGELTRLLHDEPRGLVIGLLEVSRGLNPNPQVRYVGPEIYLTLPLLCLRRISSEHRNWKIRGLRSDEFFILSSSYSSPMMQNPHVPQPRDWPALPDQSSICILRPDSYFHVHRLQRYIHPLHCTTQDVKVIAGSRKGGSIRG